MDPAEKRIEIFNQIHRTLESLDLNAIRAAFTTLLICHMISCAEEKDKKIKNNKIEVLSCILSTMPPEVRDELLFQLEQITHHE